MKKLFLRYTLLHDLNNVWRSTGFDKNGKEFGMGAGKTESEALRALHANVLKSLLESASNNIDGRENLAVQMSSPAYVFLEFTTRDLFPVTLRLTRVRRGFTQEKMAIRLCINKRSYKRYECIGVNPTLYTVMMIEQALQTSLLGLAS